MMSLAHRVEEAELNALPAERQLLFSPWLLRFSQTSSRRANSVTPLAPAEHAGLAARVRACIATYAAHGMPCLFRLPSHLAHGLDDVLDDTGFAPAEGLSRTLFRRLVAVDTPPGPVRLTGKPDAAWLEAQSRLRGEASPLPRARLLGGLVLPAAFAAAGEGGADLSLAYAVVHDGIAALNMVITDPRAQRRGLARLAVQHLLAWAQRAGADAACLQVAADNPAAIALYEGLGFHTELYRYHYRRLETV